ncbi:hypothetical protein ACCT04_34475, partial [Rhizobium ruizarguesonis]
RFRLPNFFWFTCGLPESFPAPAEPSAVRRCGGRCRAPSAGAAWVKGRSYRAFVPSRLLKRALPKPVPMDSTFVMMHNDAVVQGL